MGIIIEYFQGQEISMRMRMSDGDVISEWPQSFVFPTSRISNANHED